MKKIFIIGAGITGLTLGYLLKKNLLNHAHEISIFEKNAHPGGWIKTIEEEGFLFELGPRSCRSAGNGKYTLQLIEELGMQSQVITANPTAKKRFIYTENQLQQVPTSIFSVLFSPLMKGVLKALYKERSIPPSYHEDETIVHFATRRFGKYIAETFFDPMTLGIYAGKISELSMKSCFPIFYDWEQTHGSVIQGFFAKKPKVTEESPFIKKVQKAGLFSLQKGMSSLIQTLKSYLQNELFFNQSLHKIKTKENQLQLIFSDGQIRECDQLYLCIPAHEALKLLDLEEESPSIQATSVISVSLGYKELVLKQKGFGHLVPSKDNEPILGAVWDSCAFPEQNTSANETRLTVMLGGTLHPEMVDLSETAIQTIALDSLHRHLGINAKPQIIYTHKAKHAIPQYTLGHFKKVKKIKELVANYSKKITLLGNSYEGVSVNDCIAEAYFKCQNASIAQGNFN